MCIVFLMVLHTLGEILETLKAVSCTFLSFPGFYFLEFHFAFGIRMIISLILSLHTGILFV